MAKFVKDIEFLVIEGKGNEMLRAGMGCGGPIYEGKIEEGPLSGFDLVDFGSGGYLICDSCDKDIFPNDTCYYVAVLNEVLCEECFKKWIKRAQYCESDSGVEERNFGYYSTKFKVDKENHDTGR